MKRRKFEKVGIMSGSKRRLFASGVSVFLVALFVSATFAVSGESDVAVTIEGAEVAVTSAYAAVLEAEEAGASVSGLLARLNVAGEYLAMSHILFTSGNYDDATRFAHLCYDVGMDVKEKASELRKEAAELWEGESWRRVAMSFVGAVSVGFFSFFAWFVFKRRYQKRVLGMTPEVVSVGS